VIDGALRAGDGTSAMIAKNSIFDTLLTLYTCGRGELGQSSVDHYTGGTGTFHIRTVLTQSFTGISAVADWQFYGPISAASTAFSLRTTGDGQPYGGLGAPPSLFANPNELRIGTVSGSAAAYWKNLFGQQMIPNFGLLYGNGTNNFWAFNNSQATLAAINRSDLADDNAQEDLNGGTFIPRANRLEVWGYGGNGQFGTGNDPLFTTEAVDLTGLRNVRGGALTSGVIFAIADQVAAGGGTDGGIGTTPPGTRHTFGQVVG
jgi:hypothetical protein